MPALTVVLLGRRFGPRIGTMTGWFGPIGRRLELATRTLIPGYGDGVANLMIRVQSDR